MTAAPATKIVDLERPRDALAQLGLAHAAEQLSDVVSEAVKVNWAPHVFLERLLAAELQHREERRIKTSLRLSGLPTGYTLGGFDWSFQPGVERKQVETLATCAYIRERATVRPCCCKARPAWRRPISPSRSESGRWRTASPWPSTDWRTCCTR